MRRPKDVSARSFRKVMEEAKAEGLELRGSHRIGHVRYFSCTASRTSKWGRGDTVELPVACKYGTA